MRTLTRCSADSDADAGADATRELGARDDAGDHEMRRWPEC